MTKAIDQRGTATRSSRSPDTRDRILRAAADLLATRGWDAVTTRSVAEASGVNKALVHYHFGSVDALVQLAVTEAFAAEIGPGMALVLDADDPLDGLVALGRWLAERGDRTTGQRVLVEALNQATLRAGVREVLLEGMSGFRSRLEEALRESQVADPSTVALLMIAAIDGAAIHRLLDDRFDVEGALTTLAGAVRARKAARR